MAEIEIAPAFWPLFDDRDPEYTKRYIVYHGGRGSAKSTHAAMACLIRGERKPEKILCARQFQNSIKDSVLSLLDEQVDTLDLRKFYDVQRDAIYGKNGTEFIFRGLHNNHASIKSINGVTLCWVEEGQSVSEKSWETLIPTIRVPGSQFLVTYNIDLETDPTYQRFNISPPPNAYVRKVNYDENPFFPDVLREEMEWCRSTDIDAYMHIWEGEPRMHSDAQVFNGKWTIDRFEPPAGAEFMHGMDFGFSVDPTTAIRCYIHDGNLFLYQESYHHRLDIDRTAEVVMRDIPGIEKYVIRGDSARPETISYLCRHGIPNITGVEKWTGSVEDGISVLRSFKKIVIHESCRHAIQEAKLYSYKIHKQTGDILPEVDDKNNHIWDAVRYACDPIIQQGRAGLGYLAFMKEMVEKQNKEPAAPPERR
jgi:phage terminase large subunit